MVKFNTSSDSPQNFGRPTLPTAYLDWSYYFIASLADLLKLNYSHLFFFLTPPIPLPMTILHQRKVQLQVLRNINKDAEMCPKVSNFYRMQKKKKNCYGALILTCERGEITIRRRGALLNKRKGEK
jgi:hypothetical protein